MEPFLIVNKVYRISGIGTVVDFQTVDDIELSIGDNLRFAPSGSTLKIKNFEGLCGGRDLYFNDILFLKGTTFSACLGSIQNSKLRDISESTRASKVIQGATGRQSKYRYNDDYYMPKEIKRDECTHES